MRRNLLGTGCSLACMVLLVGIGACAKSPAQTGSGGTHGGSQSGSGGSGSGGSGSGGSTSGSGGSPSDAGHLDSGGDRADSGDGPSDAACQPGASDSSYVLIDDMETTTHGPIQLPGIQAPASPGYWYNSGAGYVDDGGMSSNDTSDPPQGSFVFTALPSPSKTLNCQASAHAAHQACALNGLYDTCGVGFEFAQMVDPDAGVGSSLPGGDATGGTTGVGGTAETGGTSGAGGGAGRAAAGGKGGPGGRGGTAGTSDNAGTSGAAGATGAGGAGGAAPSVPMVTVPFDISQYKSLTFWGMTTTPDPTTGSLQVKVSFPNTDTDPRGQICNGGGGNTSKCYNSYAAYVNFTTTWQQFTVILETGKDGGMPPEGGISIDPSWGYQDAQWLPTQVYGINWQAQRNIAPDAGPPLMTDIWVDDVYFKE